MSWTCRIMILGHTLTFRRALFPLSLIALTLILTYLGADHNYYRSTLSQKWDDKGVLSWDWTDTKEEVGCRALGRSSGQQTTKSSKTPIPNIVHFVVLSSEGEQYDLSYSSFLAIKAAIVRMNAAEIKVHTYHNGLNIRNPWWLELQGHVTLVEFERPEQGPRGLLMKDLPLAHQSDLARLNILQMEGGIYMDTDMFALKPFTDLLDSPRDIVMGHEGANRYGLSNAVMLARPVSEFLRIWQHTYRTYDPRLWNEHSVRKPKEMQGKYPHLVCPLSPTVFFWPTWHASHISYMHDAIGVGEIAELRANITAFGAMYENQLAIHAWSKHDHLKNLTASSFDVDTRFNILMRDVARAEL